MPGAWYGDESAGRLETALSDFGLSKESIKGLGAGAYLVNVLPSTVLVLGIFLLVATHLFPGADRFEAGGRSYDPGAASVAATADALGAPSLVILVLLVLVVSVALRPFQISMVQVLEGYWRRRRLTAPLLAMAVERHARRRSFAIAMSQEMPQLPITGSDFGTVARFIRNSRNEQHRIDGANAVLDQYPNSVDLIMPTLLGNILRRAEVTAGERYGLETVATYPRLYPFLSQRLGQETEVQLNVIDTAATLTLVCGVLALAWSPVLAQFSVWSLIPVGLVVTVLLAYRGARLAAGRHALLLAAAFDLHRFDMLRSMHRKLPDDATEEYQQNQALSLVLNGDYPIDDPAMWIYDHAHGGEAGLSQVVSSGQQPADGGGGGGGSEDGGTGAGEPGESVETSDEAGDGSARATSE